ncbi:hypothetical protein F4553_008062 [Allocatelliglobosispora scoriae]|uniref:Uncharacterized protein n=1 Tax=Allocatelliglobosispora scoriae TaxID=643052 RepID=A0A841C4B8_9ACTN|nr:hypothetical protein [Allocatelliglobosispora scoriae]MBB5874628.1 hypothetical protein [Allocatelliglobosispora scoriae]
MAYFGSIVLTRSNRRVPALPSVGRIGYRHVRLRELGGGWQVLETSGANDPPDLVEAVAELAELWSEPVLAAYVNAGDCVQMHWAAPGREVSSVHLPGSQSTDDCGYLHRPQFIARRDPHDVAEDLAGWAATAGLTVSRRRLERAVSHEYDGETSLSAHRRTFELIRAFGFADIPPSVTYTVDPYGEPFDLITFNMFGLAFRARSSAAARSQGYSYAAGPEQPWERQAIELDADIFAAAFADEVDRGALFSRALRVHEAEQTASAGTAPQPQEVSPGVANPLRLSLDLAESMIASHRLGAGYSYPDPAVGTGTWPELADDDPAAPHRQQPPDAARALSAEGTP